MKKRLTYLFLLMLFISTGLIAQNGVEVKLGKGNFRSDAGLSYNFFVGDDSDDFTTSINGFGSGFLFDAFTGRYSRDWFYLGSENLHLTIGAGVAISKYRFSEPILLMKENGVVTYTIDDDPDRSYGDGFFSYGKTKLVYGSVFFPANVNISAGPFYVSLGGYLDQYISGKFKRKFRENNEKEKVVIKNDEFNDYNLNKTKLGLSAMILHKESGISVGASYSTTPFFKEGEGPDLNEVRISFSYDLSEFSD